MNNEEQRRFMTNVDIGRTLEMIGIEAKYDRGQWHAKCPNGKRGHAGEDRNPSWAIRDDSNHDMHGVHACWSCGYGGNIIGLVEDVLNLRSYQDAASWLQTHSMRGQIFAPLSVEIEVITPTIIKILDVPEGVVPLAKADYKYRSYWLKKRGFHMEDAARWQIGAWADRIWIPIYNSEGQLVNWTGRAIDDREPRYMRAPKALNPDQQVVFGEAEWRRSDALGRLPWMEVCCISEGVERYSSC